MTDRISVVITTFNRPAMLVEAVRSVERQDVDVDEIIVVDDGSPTPVQLDGPPHLRVVRQANGGLAAARNRGFTESTGGIVFFLDDDDLYLPGRVRRAVRAHDSAGVVACGQQSFDDGAAIDIDDLERRSQLDESVADRVDALQLLRRTTPNFGAVSIRRDEFLPLDESYRASQDIDWWIRMGEAGRTVTRIVSPDLLSRRHGGVRHTNGRSARVDASRRLLDEHAGFFDAHPDAKAFRLARLSIMASRSGDPASGVRYAGRSLVTRPSRAGVRALQEAAPRMLSRGRRAQGEASRAPGGG